MFGLFSRSKGEKCAEELFVGLSYILSVEEDSSIRGQQSVRAYLESIPGYDESSFPELLPGVLLFALHDQLVRQFPSESDDVYGHLVQLVRASFPAVAFSVHDALARAATDAMRERELRNEESPLASVPYCVGKAMANLVSDTDRPDLAIFMAQHFLFYLEAAARLVSDVGKKYLG